MLISGNSSGHDAQRWLGETLDSIAAQSVAPDRLVVVDDASVDGTRAILEARGIPVLAAATTATDVTARIAANFEQGVRACADCDLVALGDHDDIWHPGRLAHQAGLLAGDAAALMVASDGRVIDARPGHGCHAAAGVPGAGLLGCDGARGADAARGAAVAGDGRCQHDPSGRIPGPRRAARLHDRWWSLVATAAGGLVLDDATVIDYRVQAGQQVAWTRAGSERPGWPGRGVLSRGRG